MALHDEFIPMKWDLQCGFGFSTVVSRKFSRPDAICAPAKSLFDQNYRHVNNKFSNTIGFHDLSIFGRARLMGIGSEEDGDTDGDESTHPPPICHPPRRRILTMRRRSKCTTPNVESQGVTGDSRDTEAIDEIATQISRARRIGFRPKDEVITIMSYDRPDGDSEWSPELKPHIEGAMVRYVGKTLYDVVVTRKHVYKGVRPSHKRKSDANEIISSSGTNEGLDEKAPSSGKAKDASMPEDSPVRSDILDSYHKARVEGLPGIILPI